MDEEDVLSVSGGDLYGDSVSGGDASVSVDLDIPSTDTAVLPDSDVSGTPDVPVGEEGIVTYDIVYNAVYAALNDVQTVTDGQTLPSSAISYFEGILKNQKLPVDYVAYVGQPYQYWTNNQYRTGYEYCMLYGDLKLENGNIVGDGTMIRLRSSGEQSVVIQDMTSAQVAAPLYYARSNLGNYSGIYDYNWTGLYILIGLSIGGLVWLVKKLTHLRY